MSEDRTKPTSSYKGLVSDISYLNAFKAKERKSFSQIAGILKPRDQEFSTLDKTTIYRWLALTPDAEVDQNSAHRISKAADIIRQLKDNPTEIRIARIPNTSELIPLHILDRPEYEKWQHELGIKVVIVSVKDVMEGFYKLANNLADLFIAPRFHDEAKSEFYLRFFRVASINVAGLFEVARMSPRAFAEAISDPKGERLKIACLVNAAYEHALSHFLDKHDRQDLISPVPVKNYEEAVALLVNDDVQGVIGHGPFVSNCEALIRTKHSKFKDKYNRMIFPPVKMDAFIRSESPSIVAEKSLRLMIEAVRDINKNVGEKEFWKIIDPLIGLEEIAKKPKVKGWHSAEQVLNTFDFKIQTFETSTILHFWKSPATGGSLAQRKKAS